MKAFFRYIFGPVFPSPSCWPPRARFRAFSATNGAKCFLPRRPKKGTLWRKVGIFGDVLERRC